MVPSKQQTIDSIVESLQLSKSTLQTLMHLLDQGLTDFKKNKAGMRMFPSFVSCLPSESVNKDTLVLEFDGEHVEIALVKPEAQTASAVQHEKYTITPEAKVGGAKELFQFIAERTNDFVQSHHKSDQTLPVVFVVAFPCKHDDLRAARLVKWTKEFHYKGCVSEDLHAMLDAALTEKREGKGIIERQFDKLRNLEIAAVINDTVSILAPATNTNSSCKIGLIVDIGFNACFVQDTKGSLKDKKLTYTIINTELGALGEDGCLDFCRTDFDKELDERSSIPKSQILEKMVGGVYIGELVRMVLEKLSKEGVLFEAVQSRSALFHKDSISTELVIQIESDQENAHQKATEAIKKSFGVTNCTDDDLKTVRLVCTSVCERAAFLTAAGLAALINHVNQPEVVVVVDGYLYRDHPRFKDLVHSKATELVKPGLKFQLASPENGRSIGAARIAGVSQPPSDPHTAKA